MSENNYVEKSKEEQFEYHIRDFTTNVCNMIQGCLADEHPVMEQKLREHFLRSTKTLKKSIYKMFDMDWNKGKREDKKDSIA